VSYPRYDTPPPAPAAPSANVGYLPTRTNRIRDGVAAALLLLALVLPWNLEFGVGIPGGNGLLYLLVVFVTLLALAAAAAPHLGPFSLAGSQADVRRTGLIRLALTVPYLVLGIGFVIYHLVQTVDEGGTGLVPPGAGPGLIIGIGGALLAAQPPVTSVTLEHNSFRRWYAAARALGGLSIALATLAVAFNVYWRLRYLFVTTGEFTGHDIAVIVTTLLYGAVALIAVIIASRWLLERSAAARLATTALGGSAALACTLVWIFPVGRDIDAFHGIAQNTSTAAVGYEGYLFWAAAAAIVAPTTLYAVFLIKPPTLGAYRSAAQKCLTLIAFWAFAAAVCRVVDYLIAVSLDLPHAGYDTTAMTAFDLVTGVIAAWLLRRLDRGETTASVVAAFSGALFVFTVANLAIGVALAPRYAEPSPNTPYGNNLAQQITSTFDVTICLVSLAALVAMLFTGPLAGYLGRRKERRFAETPPPPPAPSPPQPQPPTAAAPTAVPRIVRRLEDSTAVIPAPPTEEIAAPTATLRIQRREPNADATAQIPKPPQSQ